MVTPRFADVDAYIAAQPEAVRPVLEAARAAIRRGAPEAAEGISYHMPTYSLPAGPVLFLAAWKKHWSLYPVSAEFLSGIGERPELFTVEKDAIRFPLNQPAPEDLVEEIARRRAEKVRKA